MRSGQECEVSPKSTVSKGQAVSGRSACHDGGFGKNRGLSPICCLFAVCPKAKRGRGGEPAAKANPEARIRVVERVLAHFNIRLPHQNRKTPAEAGAASGPLVSLVDRISHARPAAEKGGAGSRC
jgi:hypothetical protein